jgi:hypothetical protein
VLNFKRCDNEGNSVTPGKQDILTILFSAGNKLFRGREGGKERDLMKGWKEREEGVGGV